MSADSSDATMLKEHEVIDFNPFVYCTEQADPAGMSASSKSQASQLTGETHSGGVPDLTSAVDVSHVPQLLQSMQWKSFDDALEDFQILYASFGFRVTTATSEKTKGRKRLRIGCHCSGEAVSRVTEADRVKNSSSAKIGCRFLVTLSQPEKLKGMCRITSSWDSNHCFDHTCSAHPMLMAGAILSVSQLTSSMIDKIREMTAVKEKAAIIRKRLLQDGVEWIAPHVIHTAIRRIIDAGGRSQTEELLEYLKSNSATITHDCTWETKRATGGEEEKSIQNLFWVTHQMRSMFAHYGEFVVVDATYKTNEFGRPLLVFTVRAGTGCFMIVGMALIKSESSANLQWAFDKLKQYVGDTAWSRIKVVMTDGDSSYPAIVRDFVPTAKHQRCWWHQKRNMEPLCKKASDPNKCWQLMLDAISTYDEVDAKRTWQLMLDTYWSEDQLKKHVTDDSHDAASKRHSTGTLPDWAEKLPDEFRNVLRLLNEWFDIRATYWKSMTKKLRNFGSISSQGGESMNSALKRDRSYMRLTDLVQITAALSKHQIMMQMEDTFRSQTRISLTASLREWTVPLCNTVTRHAVEELTEQLLITAAAENAIDYPVEEDLGTLIMIRNKQNRTLRVNIHNCTCSCGYVESQGLLCRHLLFVLKKTMSFEQLARKALQTAHPRWTTATLNRAMDVTILPAVVSMHNNVPWDNTQVVPSTINSKVIALRQEFDQLVKFARKNNPNADLALREFRTWLPRILACEEGESTSSSEQMSAIDYGRAAAPSSSKQMPAFDHNATSSSQQMPAATIASNQLQSTRVVIRDPLNKRRSRPSRRTNARNTDSDLYSKNPKKRRLNVTDVGVRAQETASITDDDGQSDMSDMDGDSAGSDLSSTGQQAISVNHQVAMTGQQGIGVNHHVAIPGRVLNPLFANQLND